MYSVLYSTAVRKDIKSLPKQVASEVFAIFEILEKNPRVAKKLKGEFSNCYSYSFMYNKTDYRIIYSIEDKKLIVIVVMVDSRENIYKKLKRRV